MLAIFLEHYHSGDIEKALLAIENSDVNYIFSNCCSHGELVNAQILYDCVPNINIHYNQSYAFHNSCANGHLSVVKWLWTLSPIINSSIINELFIKSCYHGHIEIAQWLMDNEQCINIHADYDAAFICSIINRQILVYQWLISITKYTNHPLWYHQRVVYIINPVKAIDDYFVIQCGEYIINSNGPPNPIAVKHYINSIVRPKSARSVNHSN
jgi:hypothetical protein